MLVLPVLNWVIIELLAFVRFILDIIIFCTVFLLLFQVELVRVAPPDKFAEVTAVAL